MCIYTFVCIYIYIYIYIYQSLSNLPRPVKTGETLSKPVNNPTAEPVGRPSSGHPLF